MFHKVCEKIVLSGIENGTIANEQKDEHLYGMNMLFNVTINIISMVIIGIVTGRPLECIMFCFIYKTIRKYTGGFHFESAWICYISSCVMYLLVMAAILFRNIQRYSVGIGLGIFYAGISVVAEIKRKYLLKAVQQND
jgi:accessory gene regulator B